MARLTVPLAAVPARRLSLALPVCGACVLSVVPSPSSIRFLPPLFLISPISVCVCLLDFFLVCIYFDVKMEERVNRCHVVPLNAWGWAQKIMIINNLGKNMLSAEKVKIRRLYSKWRSGGVVVLNSTDTPNAQCSLSPCALMFVRECVRARSPLSFSLLILLEFVIYVLIQAFNYLLRLCFCQQNLFMSCQRYLLSGGDQAVQKFLLLKIGRYRGEGK